MIEPRAGVLTPWADLTAGAVTMSYERTVEYERVLRPDA